jgi:hypothetical protein
MKMINVRRQLAAFACAAAGASSLVLTTTSVAQAAPAVTPSSVTAFEITNGRDQRCLDQDTRSTTPITKMQVFDCWGGGNQLWSLKADGSIVNLRDLNCLEEDVSNGPVNGAAVQTAPCTGAANQRWDRRSDHSFRNAFDGRCMDEDLVEVPANFTRVQVWDCFVGLNQQWSLV